MNKSIKMLIVAVAVAVAPLFASEVELLEPVIVVEQQEEAVTSYKNRSAQVAAALATVAVVTYVVAVCKNKVASPVALFTGFFAAKNVVAETVSTEVAQDNSQTEEKKDILPISDNVSDIHDRSVANNLKALFNAVTEKVGTISVPNLSVNEASYQQKVDAFNLAQ